MAKQQQSGSGDNSLDFLWLVVLIVAVVYGTWAFGKEYIAAFIYHLRYYEILLLHQIAGLWQLLVGWAGIPSLNLTSLNYWIAVVDRDLGPSEFSVLTEISHDVGMFYRYGMAVILGGLGAVVYFCSASSRFNVTQSMKTLLNAEQEIWHAVTPVLGKDLIKEDIDKGEWRMVMTPMSFVKHHGIAIETTKDRKPALEVIPGRARRIFTMQLGPLWVSAHHLPIYMQALFVIFASRGIGKRKIGDDLLEQIARTAQHGKMDFSGTKLAMVKLRNNDLIAKVVYRHAFVSTVMAAMLEFARCDGVLATSEFLWLKPLDRNLWYVLNDVGRQTPCVESAGVLAHLVAERKFGRPLRVPMVDEAIVALEDVLAEILYEPEED